MSVIGGGGENNLRYFVLKTFFELKNNWNVSMDIKYQQQRRLSEYACI